MRDSPVELGERFLVPVADVQAGAPEGEGPAPVLSTQPAVGQQDTEAGETGLVVGEWLCVAALGGGQDGDVPHATRGASRLTLPRMSD